MISKSVFDPEFADYGKVVEGYDFTALLGVLRQISPKPEDAVIYVPSVEELEALPVCQELYLLISGIKAADYPLVQSITLLMVFVFLCINLLVDIFYAVLDPRIRMK